MEGTESSGVSERMKESQSCSLLTTSGSSLEKEGAYSEISSSALSCDLDSLESKSDSESDVSINLGALERLRKWDWKEVESLICVSLRAKMIRSCARRELVTFK